MQLRLPLGTTLAKPSVFITLSFRQKARLLCGSLYPDSNPHNAGFPWCDNQRYLRHGTIGRSCLSSYFSWNKTPCSQKCFEIIQTPPFPRSTPESEVHSASFVSHTKARQALSTASWQPADMPRGYMAIDHSIGRNWRARARLPRGGSGPNSLGSFRSAVRLRRYE